MIDIQNGIRVVKNLEKVIVYLLKKAEVTVTFEILRRCKKGEINLALQNVTQHSCCRAVQCKKNETQIPQILQIFTDSLSFCS